MTDEEKNFTVKINKVSLLLNIILVVSTVLTLSSSRIFDYFFMGNLEETKLFSSFPESYKGRPYYEHVFKYKHTNGKPILNTTIDFYVENSGSVIDFYEPRFKSLFNSKSIIQIKDQNRLKIEILEIRPGDEFDFFIYTKDRAKILSSIVTKNGRINRGEEHYLIKNPTVLLVLLMVGYGFLSHYFYGRSLKIVEKEKMRIIGERDALQNIILAGNRMSSKRGKSWMLIKFQTMNS